MRDFLAKSMAILMWSQDYYARLGETVTVLVTSLSSSLFEEVLCWVTGLFTELSVILLCLTGPSRQSLAQQLQAISCEARLAKRTYWRYIAPKHVWWHGSLFHTSYFLAGWFACSFMHTWYKQWETIVPVFGAQQGQAISSKAWSAKHTYWRYVVRIW